MLNGQVMIAAIRTFLDDGLPLVEAVVGGAKQRLLPVVATAVVDAAGFLPMARPVGSAPRCSGPWRLWSSAGR